MLLKPDTNKSFSMFDMILELPCGNKLGLDSDYLATNKVNSYNYNQELLI